MARKKTLPTNPLDSKASLYLKKLNKNGAIHLKPLEQTLEFYPAGYTKSGRRGHSRQNVLQQMWELAVSLGTEDSLYPFDRISHNIRLVHTRSNPKDPHAMYVVLESPTPGSSLGHLDGRDIGWVPQRISEQIHKNEDMIMGGRILKIRSKFHEKYYTAKIILGYGKNSNIVGSDMGQSTRFADMMEEIG